MIRSIPNIITLSNLFTGCIACILIINNQISWALVCLAYCLVADFLDGALARILNAQSEIGKQLDSLADLISFGMVPAFLMYSLLMEAAGSDPSDPFPLAALPAFLITVFSALRLARFNVKNDGVSFRGLPTPANAIFFAGLIMVPDSVLKGLAKVTGNIGFLYGMIFVFSYLLISDLRMFSLKIKHLSWKGNEMVYIFAILVVLLLIIFREAGISLIIIVYILFSLIRNFFQSDEIFG